jgi:hypothetical protein
MSVRIEVEPIAVAAHIESERPVKRLGGRKIRNREHETIQRMHAERILTPRHRRLATRDPFHDHPPRAAAVPAGYDDSKFSAPAPMAPRPRPSAGIFMVLEPPSETIGAN